MNITGYGISFTFGVGDGFDAAQPVPIPRNRPAPQHSPTQGCLCRPNSPDDSGGSWMYQGRLFRRDADGRVWVKKEAAAPQPPPPEQTKPQRSASWVTIPDCKASDAADSASDGSSLSQSPDRTPKL